MLQACLVQIRPSILFRAARYHLTRHSSTVVPAPPTINSLLKHETASKSLLETLVTVNGYVRSIRKQKRVAFAAIGDGSTIESLQAVLKPEQAIGLSTGVAVRLIGTWEPSPMGKEQIHELHVQHVKVLGNNEASSYPIQKKYHTAEFLRTLPHLRSRLPYNALLLRLRSLAIGCATAFFEQEGYIQTHPPLITSSDCEGAGEAFNVATAPVIQSSSKSLVDQGSNAGAFFRNTKHLTVSSQLHLEALAQSVGNVWTLSPTFRAERSDTPRHLSEFYMLEAEATFVDDLAPIMDIVEQLLRSIARHLMDSQVGEELLSARSSQGELKGSPDIACNELRARWNGLVHSPWPRITYSEAIDTLQHAVSTKGAVFDFTPKFGIGLQAEHEKYLARAIGQGSPVFVTDYPWNVKAFYMAPSKSSPDTQESSTTVACFDLLVPEICEIVGGSLREYRLPQLLESMQRHGLLKPGYLQEVAQAKEVASSLLSDIVPPSLQWYIDLRRFGSVPHGGFGLGFDRLLCYLSGVSNIRDMVAFPRWYGRCDC